MVDMQDGVVGDGQPRQPPQPQLAVNRLTVETSKSNKKTV